MVEEYGRAGHFDTGVPRAQALYAVALGGAVGVAVDAHMPAGCTWSEPTGGMFTWVTLPVAPRHARAAPGRDRGRRRLRPRPPVLCRRRRPQRDAAVVQPPRRGPARARRPAAGGGARARRWSAAGLAPSVPCPVAAAPDPVAARARRPCAPSRSLGQARSRTSCQRCATVPPSTTSCTSRLSLSVLVRGPSTDADVDPGGGAVRPRSSRSRGLRTGSTAACSIASAEGGASACELARRAAFAQPRADGLRHVETSARR